MKAKGFAAIEEQYANWKGDKRQYFQEFNEPNDTDELSKAENTPKDVAAKVLKTNGANTTPRPSPVTYGYMIRSSSLTESA